MEFKEGVIFTYNQKKKRLFVLMSFAAIVLFLGFILNYIFFFRFADNLIVNAINSASSHVFQNLKSTTLLGAFYTALFGGLFFVVIPMEAVFITFIKGVNPYLVNIIYIGGILISYSFDYYIGYKLAGVSKKIITPKKFYKIKGIINRYGSWAVFGFNVLPLPSQPLSAILGVFRYNIKRFYLFMLSGQIIKYAVITALYKVIL